MIDVDVLVVLSRHCRNYIILDPKPNCALHGHMLPLKSSLTSHSVTVYQTQFNLRNYSSSEC